MPGKRTANHALEPGPVSLRTHHGMDADKSTSRFDIPPEGQPLSIRIEYVVVGTGKNQKGIVFQIIFREDNWLVRHVDGEPVFLTKLLNAQNGIGNVVVNVAFTIFGKDQHLHFFPVNRLAVAGAYGDDGQEKKENRAILYRIMILQGLSHLPPPTPS